MPIVRTRSLNHRLWVIVGLAVLPLFFIALHDYQFQRQAAVRNVDEQVKGMLFAAQQEEAAALDSVRLVFEIMARADNMQRLDPADCSGLSARLLASLNGFANLGAALPDGTVFCSGVPAPGPVTVTDRIWFNGATHSEGISAGEFTTSRISGALSFVFGYPLRDEHGKLRAVMFASLRGDWFARLMSDYKLPDGWQASLITMDGRVLAQHPVPSDGSSQKVPQEALSALLGLVDMPGRIGEVPDLGGRSRLFGVERTGITVGGALVAISAPPEQSLSQLNVVFAWRIGILLGVALLSALLARYYVHRLIERWVLRMGDAIGRIASGRLDTRIEPLSGVSEFAGLEEGVNHMAGELDRRASELRRLSMAVQQSPECIVITDATGSIEYVNDAFVLTSGYSREELIGSDSNILNAGLTPRETYEDLWRTIGRGDVWRGEFYNQRKDGSRYVELATVAPIKEADGRVTHYVAVKEDVTVRRQSEELLHRLAHYDSLTELPNRAMLSDRLQQAVLASARSRQYAVLVLLDIDRFQELNDTLGHGAGDRLLREIAARLRAVVGEGDTVARQGDDDFVVISENAGDSEEDALAHAEKLSGAIHAALGRPYALVEGDGLHHATASVGVTVFAGRQVRADALLRQAEVALARAKQDGRNVIRFFSLEMQATVEAHARIARALSEGLENDRFLLFYQPQVDADGGLVGVEALIRLRGADGGLVTPGDFIPVAEESGLIVPIGDWVLGTACLQLARWQAQPATRALTMSVNVSGRQFHRPDFVEGVAAHIERSGIDPVGLKLELTESIVLGNVADTVARMAQLRALGVRFSLDDFGTGYSSLAYLKSLPFDQLKIDQSFVRDMDSDANSMAIVRAILAISESLGLEVVAEGVETAEQCAALRADGCHLMQGFLFSRPAPIEVIEALECFPSLP